MHFRNVVCITFDYPHSFSNLILKENTPDKTAHEKKTQVIAEKLPRNAERNQLNHELCLIVQRLCRDTKEVNVREALFLPWECVLCFITQQNFLLLDDDKCLARTNSIFKVDSSPPASFLAPGKEPKVFFLKVFCET